MELNLARIAITKTFSGLIVTGLLFASCSAPTNSSQEKDIVGDAPVFTIGDVLTRDNMNAGLLNAMANAAGKPVYTYMGRVNGGSESIAITTLAGAVGNALPLNKILNLPMGDVDTVQDVGSIPLFNGDSRVVVGNAGWLTLDFKVRVYYLCTGMYASICDLKFTNGSPMIVLKGRP